METLVNLGRISYINVAPVYFGLDNGLRPKWLKLVNGHPNTLNKMMEDGELDVSPVSSASYARNAGDWLILPDLSIACHEKVLSVLLVSRYAINDMAGRRILITDESSSARDLCRLIFNLKGVNPEFVIGRITCPLPENIDAALVIGDKALSCNWSKEFQHVFDLGTYWWNMTGLPFVFAVWAVRKEFAEKEPEKVCNVLELLKKSTGLGKKNIDILVQRASMTIGIDFTKAYSYYDYLKYGLSDREIRGLELFYKGLFKAGLTDNEARLCFFDDFMRKQAGR